MKRILYIFLLSLAVLLQAEARTPMRSWLVAMPDSVLPLLTKNNRLDFIDFFDAKMEAVVTNCMDGKSRMDTLTDDFLRINYTKSADVTMKLLPINDTTDILCMVTTIKTAAKDSRIAFYDVNWKPLKTASYISEPHLEDYRLTLPGDSAEWAWSKLDVFFRTYHLCAEETNLRCVLATTDYLSENDRKEITPYLRQTPIIYHWADGQYHRNEQ